MTKPKGKNLFFDIWYLYWITSVNTCSHRRHNLFYPLSQLASMVINIRWLLNRLLQTEIENLLIFGMWQLIIQHIGVHWRKGKQSCEQRDPVWKYYKRKNQDNSNNSCSTIKKKWRGTTPYQFRTNSVPSPKQHLKAFNFVI